MNEQENAKTLIEMIKDIKFAMLTTVSDDGHLHSRPMGNITKDLKQFDGTLWFFSKKNSFKNHDIENEQHVNLAYADPDKHHYVSVCGRAFVSTDKEKMKELWNPMLKTWFPEGLDDPEISLIGVEVDNAEIWDSPSSTVVHALGFIKQAVTGKPLDQNINSKHIDLQ